MSHHEILVVFTDVSSPCASLYYG